MTTFPAAPPLDRGEEGFQDGHGPVHGPGRQHDLGDEDVADPEPLTDLPHGHEQVFLQDVFRGKALAARGLLRLTDDSLRISREEQINQCCFSDHGFSPIPAHFDADRYTDTVCGKIVSVNVLIRWDSCSRMDQGGSGRCHRSMPPFPKRG